MTQEIASFCCVTRVYPNDTHNLATIKTRSSFICELLVVLLFIHESFRVNGQPTTLSRRLFLLTPPQERECKPSSEGSSFDISH